MISPVEHPPSIDDLSERERAVAQRFSSGMTYREIGDALFIAPSTVRTHIAAIYQKLGVRNKIGLAALFGPPAPTLAPETVQPGSLPVVAMFPIECLNPEERWQRFADGLTSDITISLARHSGLPVIAFHTMKSLHSDPGSFLRDGKALGAAYIISGQLRTDGEQMRLTLQLSDAQSGISLWSERYDRKLEQVFALQDSLTDSVINALTGSFGTLATLGRNATRRKPPTSLQAYDFYLLGAEWHNTFTPEGNAEAIRLFSRVIELDPTLAAAWTELAFAYSVQASNGYSEDVHASIENWRKAIENALLLDPGDSVAHQCQGDVCAALGDFAGARRAHALAFEYGTNHADTLALLASTKALVLGDLADAMPLIQRAQQLNPLAPPWYHGVEGRILFLTGQYRDSLNALARSAAGSPSTLLFQAMAYACDGQADAASRVAGRLMQEFPTSSVKRFIAGYPVTNPVAVDAMLEGAVRAGLK